MIRWIKYKLFMWLWNDICVNSECRNCVLCDEQCTCLDMEFRLINQAKSAWIIK